MSNKNYLTKLAEELADKECQKTTLIDKYGSIMYASGHVGSAILGVIGGVADFAVFYGILYSTFQIAWLCFIFAAVGAGLIQVLFGRSAFQLTRSLYEGDHALKEYRSTIFSALVIVLFSLFATLWLSVNTTPIVHAVNEGNLELVNTEAIRAQYNTEIAQLRDAQKAEEAKALSQVAQLQKDVTAKGEIRWNSHKTINKIHAEQLPTIASRYDRSIASAEKSRDKAIAEAMETNSNATETFSQKVTFGAITIKGINIVINLLRLVLLAALAMFLSDVYQQRKGKRSSAPSSSFAPAFSQAPRAAMVTAEYVSAPAPISTDTVTPQPVTVKPFQNRAEPNTMEWDLSRTVELSPNISGTAGTGTAGTQPEPVRENAQSRVPAGNGTRNTNSRNTQAGAERVTYVNDKGERKEYTRAEVQSLCRKYAKRVKEHQAKGNDAAVENNLRKLEQFKSLIA